MSRSLSLETLQKIGQTVELGGWVNAVRSHGKLIFLDLRDRAGIVQIVLNPQTYGHDFSPVKKLKSEDVISILGRVKKREGNLVNPNLETGSIEIEASEVKTLSEAEKLPFDLGAKELDLSLVNLLDYRSLTLRHPKVKAIFKVQETILQSFRKTMKEIDFTEFAAPIIVASATEGGAEVFPVDYYDYRAYLGQSPQLYKQIMVSIFERVFTLGYAFRAEPSVTTRHLSEYRGLDVEMGYITDFADIMDVVEKVIKNVFADLKSERSVELGLHETTVPQISERIPRIHFKKVKDILFVRTGRDQRGELNLEPAEEREICRWAKEKYGSELIFVTHYPTKKRPFYTFVDPSDPTYTYSFDLLGRGVEWVTGGQRINKYEELISAMKRKNLNPADFEIYLQAFRYGMPPEGGFCIGLERITQLVLGLVNIREATLFPRDMERVDQRLSVLQPHTRKVPQNLYRAITSLLEKEKIAFKKFEHEPVYTSEQAAKVRGTKLEEGAKALIVFADQKPLMLVLSAAQKVDVAKLKKELMIKNFRMASADEVKALSGVEIGAVPPFGNLLNLETFFDAKLSKNEKVSFNAGEHTKSLQLKYKDLEKLVKPKILDFSK